MLNLNANERTHGALWGAIAGDALGVAVDEWIDALARKGDLDCLIHEFAGALQP